MEKMMMNLEIHIDKKLDFDIDVSEVVDAINQMEMKNRWNYLANLINNIDLNSKDLIDEHKQIVINYLKNKLEIFENGSK
jgi:hypothetical protein